MKQLLSLSIFTLSFFLFACNQASEKVAEAAEEVSTSATEAVANVTPNKDFKISLAQWSLNKAYRSGEKNPYRFAEHAKEMGFTGIEYVNQLYAADIKEGKAHEGSIKKLFAQLDKAAADAGITEVLIMIDNEGSLGDTNEKARLEAVENHKYYIDAASSSRIPTIRVNAAGNGSKEDVRTAAIKSLMELGAYAKTRNVNVVVENHGGYSSDPEWLKSVMASIHMTNVGILPDFGNFCRTRDPRGWEFGCLDEVPLDSTYTAVGMWMPFAHAVSAKSNGFDAAGNEVKIDYARMMDTVLAHGYSGFVGVEFEGSDMTEEEGIMATKALLERQLPQ